MDDFSLHWTTDRETETRIEVFDLSGLLITSRSMQSINGLNTADFSMEDRAAGIYLVLIRTPEELTVLKWIKIL
jgi:hypothetical protein